jgi:hypothetical protein
VSYRAQVRVKGRPAQSETFPNRKEAQQWAQSIETAIREGRHFPHAAARRASFDALAKDYTDTVLAEGAAEGAGPARYRACRHMQLAYDAHRHLSVFIELFVSSGAARA